MDRTPTTHHIISANSELLCPEGLKQYDIHSEMIRVSGYLFPLIAV